MSKLYNFLADIAINPQQQLAFMQSPAAAIAVAELSVEDKDIVGSREGDKIAAAFASELSQRTIIFREPEPDPTPDPEPKPEYPDPSPELGSKYAST